MLCSNEQFRDPVHVAPLNAPVELCRSYGFYVCYHLEDGEPVEQDGRPTRNAFQILMSSHTQRILPGRIEGDSLSGDQRLRNAVIDVLEKAQVGWSPQMVSSAGSACVSQITSALLVPAICTFCKSEQKSPFTRHPLNAVKRKRTK